MKTKTLILVISILLFVSCSDRQNEKAIDKKFLADSIIKHDTVFKYDTVYYNNNNNNNNNNWQEGFELTNDPEIDSIWGKPVKYYIDNPKCSPIAKDFYFKRFRPSDNYTTEALLNLAMTDDNDLRPFYRWCLNKTIIIQDGALGEYTGVPARQYAEKFPQEFFQYMDIDSTLGKYKDWVGSISYSGYYKNEDYKNTKHIRQKMASKMKRNCINCDIILQNRIEKFTNDCFP